MIDPSLWQDEGMAELTPRQQLLYVGMFSNADDDGRLKGSASAIRLILPTLFVGCALDDIDRDIDAVLLAFRQLIRYEACGRVYIAFRNYRKWQKIERPSPSVLPAPPLENADTALPQVKLKEEKLTEEKEVPPIPPAPEQPDAPPPDGGDGAPIPVSVLSKQQLRRFERWYLGRAEPEYDGYPKKTHRPAAEREWKKLNPDDDLTVAMIADTKARRFGRKWSESFIEDPARYLKERVWEDDIEPIRAATNVTARWEARGQPSVVAPSVNVADRWRQRMGRQP
jgi:hypothetical protein